MKMIGHDDECMQQETALIAVVEKCRLQQFSISRDLKKPPPARGYTGHEVRADFLRSKVHGGSVLQRPAAKAVTLNTALRGPEGPRSFQSFYRISFSAPLNSPSKSAARALSLAMACSMAFSEAGRW